MTSKTNHHVIGVSNNDTNLQDEPVTRKYTTTERARKNIN